MSAVPVAHTRQSLMPDTSSCHTYTVTDVWMYGCIWRLPERAVCVNTNVTILSLEQHPASSPARVRDGCDYSVCHTAGGVLRLSPTLLVLWFLHFSGGLKPLTEEGGIWGLHRVAPPLIPGQPRPDPAHSLGFLWTFSP